MKRRTSKASKSSYNDNETYAVEKILKTRKRAGKREYLIKWDGWPASDATWEAESDCDCAGAIEEFYRTNKLVRSEKGKRKNTSISQPSSDETRGPRRATLDEIKGIEPEKKRRTVHKEQSTPKAKMGVSKELKGRDIVTDKKHSVINAETPVKRPSAAAADNVTSVQEDSKAKNLPDIIESESEERKEKLNVTPRVTRRSGEAKALSKQVNNLRRSGRSATRGSSYDSDEGSTHARFLRLKKKKEDAEIGSANPDSSSSKLSDDRVYKIQQGHKIEKILGVKNNEPPIQYAVLYKGTAPKHQRMEYVPGKVLRAHAIEMFVDFLEGLVVQSTCSTETSC